MTPFENELVNGVGRAARYEPEMADRIAALSGQALALAQAAARVRRGEPLDERPPDPPARDDADPGLVAANRGAFRFEWARVVKLIARYEPESDAAAHALRAVSEVAYGLARRAYALAEALNEGDERGG